MRLRKDDWQGAGPEGRRRGKGWGGEIIFDIDGGGGITA